jgi:hypothetical protein
MGKKTLDGWWRGLVTSSKQHPRQMGQRERAAVAYMAMGRSVRCGPLGLVDVAVMF